ncbi:MAG TPA: citrate synthase [Kofleriaceae bacterium]
MVDQRRIDDQRWVDARTAARHLGIQVRSLYAYVSRGQVRSVPGEKGRPRLYALGDLERLRVRRDARTGHGPVAAGAMRWGEPVLDSAITAITARGPAYRGLLAVDLAEQGTRFENVAELLWSGFLPTEPVTWPRVAFSPATIARALPHVARPLDVMALVVPLAAFADPDRDDRRPDMIIGRGRRVIPLLAAALAGTDTARLVRSLGGPTVATVAARALGLDDELAPILDRVLVLLADHELNASSFTARVTASTDADPYACIAAALATLSGVRHGAASEEVSQFADEVGSPDAVRAAVRALKKRDQVPPGFGHPLYPHGDPRTAPVLAAATALRGNKKSQTLIALAGVTTDAFPTVDVALAALVAALGLPPAAATGLFAVARTAGWLAHAIEQRAANFLLRPRARYVGPAVTSP